MVKRMTGNERQNLQGRGAMGSSTWSSWGAFRVTSHRTLGIVGQSRPAELNPVRRRHAEEGGTGRAPKELRGNGAHETIDT